MRLNIIFLLLTVSSAVFSQNQLINQNLNQFTPEQQVLASQYLSQLNTTQGDSLSRTLVESNENSPAKVDEVKKDVPNLSSLEQQYNATDILNSFNISLDQMIEDQMTPIKQFGYNVFSTKFNVPISSNHVPKNYLLQTNDIMTIFMYGKKEQVNQFKLDEDGAIFFPGIGPITVGGLTLNKAKQVILKKVNKKFVNINIDLKLNTQKKAAIVISGDVKLPGTYFVNKFSSIISVISSAKGVNKTGSLRNLTLLKTNGEKIEIDIYDYLLKDSNINSIYFNDGDILYVPKIGDTVAIKGQVKQPGIYEILPGESIQNIIDFASGFNLNAYKNTIAISRLNHRFKRTVLEVQSKNQIEMTKKLNKKVVQNGDVIQIFERSNKVENYVRVLGHVNVPAHLSFESGMTLGDAIFKVEGVKDSAYDFIHIYRYVSQTDRKLLRKRVNDNSFKLKAQDIIVVYSDDDLKEKDSIEITGEVIDPGKYVYFKEMTLFDAIILAKLKTFASESQIEVSRFSGDFSSILYFSLIEAKNVSLKPGDKINIKYDNLKDQTISIELIGEFVFPGKYTVNKGTKLADVIQKAGGYTNSAYLKAAIFSRQSVKEYDELGQEKVIEDEKRRLIYDQSHLGSLSTDSQISFGVMMTARQEALKFLERKSKSTEGRVVIDLHREDFIQSEDNFKVQDGDRLEVPTRPESVHLIGGVQQGVSMAYNPSFNTYDYISNVGGFTKYADKSNIYVFKTSGRVFQNYSNIEPGDIIYVPEKVRISFNWLQFLTNITSIVSNAVTSIALVRSLQ